MLVCTPDDPTGTTVGDAELDLFLERVPEDVLVVINEAYLKFVARPRLARRARPAPITAQRRGAAYLLQGLRSGGAARRLCVAHEPVAEALRKAAIPLA